MNLIHTAIAFLFAICVLIVFHELGHYWVARLCNVKVLRFSLGMGKVIFSRRVGPDQTEWVISALPLGGYVKMLDLREQENLQLSKEDIHQPIGLETYCHRRSRPDRQFYLGNHSVRACVYGGDS